MVYKGTGVSSAGLRQENVNRSRCIRLYNGWSIVNGI